MHERKLITVEEFKHVCEKLHLHKSEQIQKFQDFLELALMPIV